jgi:hypothetical protein
MAGTICITGWHIRRIPERDQTDIMPTRRQAPKVTGGGYNIGGAIATAIIGMLATLIGTGIVSTIILYSHVATLTEAEMRTEQQLQRTLDHAVDKDDYLRRDTQIQRAMDNMATKDDIRTLRSMILDILSGNPRAEKYRE